MRALVFLCLASCLSLTRDFPDKNAKGLCGNFVKDGAETDTDCGGDACAPCLVGQTCLASGDCETGQCEAGLCSPIRCDDGVKSDRESDIDCGGACPPCAIGDVCRVGTDCAFALCTSGRCEPRTQSLESALVPARLGQTVAFADHTVAAAAAPSTGDAPFTPEIVVWTRATTQFDERARISSDGAVLALTDDALFVGVPGPTLAGRVDLFDAPSMLASTAAPNATLAPTPSAAGDRFGDAVAVAQTLLAVSAPGSNRVFVFTRASSGWSQQREVGVMDPSSVTISQTTLAVGVASAATVHVYGRQGTQWPEQQAITPGRAGCGVSLALVDDDLLIGCDGAALLYHRNGATWSLVYTLTGEPGASAAARSVALATGVAIAGDPQANKVHLHFLSSDGAWGFSQSLTTQAAGSLFGQSVAASQTLLAVGAPGDNPVPGGTARGEVYVFGAP